MKDTEMTTLEYKEELRDEEEAMDCEELENLLNSLMEIQIDTSNLEGVILDEKEFGKGVKYMSKFAGMFTCLKNVGMNSEEALTLILNESNIKATHDQQKEVNDMQKYLAKNQLVQIEKNQV